jgi:enterochelin esterase-like enzyme
MRDPLNPNSSCYGDFSRNSELRMPLFLSPPEIESYDIPHGKIKVLQYYDSNRIIQVYLPPGYPENRQGYPCAYFHDGSSYLSIGMAKNVLDYLIYHKKIKPIIAVFIDPLNRDDEYYYGYQYMDTFIKSIIPYVEKNYACDHKAANRAILGYSLGGLSALLFSLHHPDVFENCAAYSPAIFTGDIIEQYENAPVLPTKFYIDAGTFENWIYDPALELAIIIAGKRFNGRFYTWYEYHSFCSWRAHLDEALIYFYGTGS